MKRLIFAVCVLGVALASSAMAQDWSPEQQQILERVKTGWTLWQEALLKKDYNIWLEGFEPSEDWQGWWITNGGLWNIEAEKRTFDNYVKQIKDFYWETVQPLSIQIYDEMALIYFYVTFNEQDKSGEWTRIENKRLEVYRKQDGKWRWTGCMAAGREIGPFIEKK
ncbi:hypothetical protein ACFLR7_02830 [Acidobacteriota bacterium]